ncbi:hypothetical protein [Filimonas lacunae]|nr:hypothetical protein [Filimonas lacunae]
MDIQHKRITARVRPLRYAVLFDIATCKDYNTILRIIEWYSNFWGGNTNLIIPTDGKTIPIHYWKLLKSYSPDYIYSYQISDIDEYYSNPKQFEEKYKDEINNLIKKHASRDAALQFLVAKLTATQKHDQFIIDEQLAIQIEREVKPFYASSKELIGKMRAGGHSEPNALHIHKFIYSESSTPYLITSTDYTFENVSSYVELLIRTRIGSMKTVGEYLKDRRHLRYNQNFELRYEKCTPSGVDKLFESTRYLYEEFGERISHTKPFGLEWITTKDYHPEEHMSIIIVVGRSVSDFCFYYNLRQNKRLVFWVPGLVADNLEKYEFDICTSIFDTISHQIGTYVYSTCSINFVSDSYSKLEIESQLDGMFINFGLHWRSDDIEASYTPMEMIDTSIDFRRYDFKTKDNSWIQQIYNGVSSAAIHFPAPGNLTDLYGRTGSWMVDFNVTSDDEGDRSLGYVLPSNNEVLATFFSDVFSSRKGMKHKVRNSDSAISIQVPVAEIHYPFEPGNALTTQSRVKLLDGYDIFEILFKKIGAKIAHSDKGKYMGASIELFGGLSELADTLLNDKILNIFNQFLVGDPKNIPSEERIGCFLKNENRTYLSYADFEKIAGVNSKELRGSISDFLRKKILLRGLILQCERCSYLGWYRMEEIGQQFVCNRCYSEQVYTERHWRMPEQEPGFYYKLDEMFYQGLNSNMRVPVLSLNVMKEAAKYCFIYIPEVKIWDSAGKLSEVDLLCIVDGRVVIGEAKSNGKVTPLELEKYRVICNAIEGTFLFSSGATVADEKRKNIAKMGWIKEPLIIDGRDLKITFALPQLNKWLSQIY